jgi:hypothetical protein
MRHPHHHIFVKVEGDLMGEGMGGGDGISPSHQGRGYSIGHPTPAAKQAG